MPSLLDSGSIFRLKRAAGLLDQDQETPQAAPFGGGPQQAPLNPYNLFKPFDPSAAPPNAPSPLDMPAPTQGQGNGSMVQPPPSMSDNIGQGIRVLLGADTMPAGYDALFSKADLKATKKSIPHLLANWMLGPSAGDETKANLEQIDKMRQMAVGRDKTVQMEAGRKSLAASIDWSKPGAGQEYVSGMMQLGADPKEMAQAYKDMAPEKPAAALAREAFSFSDNFTVNGKREAVRTGNHGSFTTIDGKPLDPSKVGVYTPPRATADDRQPIFHDKEVNGKVVTMMSRDNGRTFTEWGNAPKSFGAAITPIARAAKVRLDVGIAGMKNAEPGFQEYENKLKKGDVNISTLNQFLGMVGGSFSENGVAAKATQAASLSWLNHSDPALARYVRRGLQFAEDESFIAQRASDFRTKMFNFLSTVASGNPKDPEYQKLIVDVQGRREAIITALNDEFDTKGGATPPGEDKTITRAEWDAVKATGVDPKDHGYKLKP